MEMNLNERPDVNGYELRSFISNTEILHSRGDVLRLVVEQVANKLAERYILDHGAEILTALDPKAIANLTIADAANSIREGLEHKNKLFAEQLRLAVEALR